MKRSEALAPLSRDHHQALAMSLRLRRTTDPVADRDAFAVFFASETVPHFTVEEDVLLPAVADVLPASDPDVVRMLAEHAELRRRADDVAATPDPDPQALHELGELLAAHVRLEERIIFPRIEARLDPVRLRELGARVSAAEEAAGS